MLPKADGVSLTIKADLVASRSKTRSVRFPHIRCIRKDTVEIHGRT